MGNASFLSKELVDTLNKNKNKITLFIKLAYPFVRERFALLGSIVRRWVLQELKHLNGIYFVGP